jgi:hypothetical protein
MSWLRYLDGENNGVSTDDTDGAHAPLDSFNCVLHLEEMAIWREDCDGRVVRHLKSF